MYVPDLIPKEHRVLTDYFKRHANTPSTRSGKIWQTVSMVVAIIFFLAAIANVFNHFWLGLLLGLLGFIFLPNGQRWIEKKLQFQLSPKIKTGFSAALLIASGFASSHYAAVDKEIAYQKKLEAERKEQARIETERVEKARVDSLNFYLEKADKLSGKKQFKQAIDVYGLALNFAGKEKTDILSKKANCLVSSGKYEAAITEITSLLNAGQRNSELYLQRAICYTKGGKIENAVGDLQSSINMGNADAEKMHNKINPIRKRVVGYVTRCCDGSTSSARGRGACSHHGGVCNWNDPIYQEYRKYE
jgi:tetratricopeptide (TPR) repeat protein